MLLSAHSLPVDGGHPFRLISPEEDDHGLDTDQPAVLDNYDSKPLLR